MSQQTITILDNIQPGYLGKEIGSSRNDANLRASFPESPIYKGELTDNEKKNRSKSLC